MITLRLIAISILLLSIHIGWAQCPDNNTFVTNLTLVGAPSLQSASVPGGGYVVVNVCAGASYSASTCGSTAFDTQITVYNNVTGAYIAYNDDACGLQSNVTWVSTFTGTVRVLVDAYPCMNSASSVLLSIAQNTNCSVSTIPNDPCSGAIPIACGGTVNGTTTGATGDTFPAGCGFGSAPGVWYRFTGNGQQVVLSLCGSAYDTQISVFSGSCGSLSCVTNNDDFCGLQSQVTFNSVNGTTYYVLVWGFSSSSGTFNLQMSCNTFVPTPQDCSGSIPICNDTQFGGNSGGYGSMQELNASNQGCLSVEHQSSWYIFQPTTTGTISFTINPTPAVDYDFAIWGPMSAPTCPPSGPPLRCSFSSILGPTGLGNGATDLTEGISGDSWVAPISVGAAQVNQYYIMLLDNFSSTSTPFIFDWSLSGVILNCSIVLPVELLSFDGNHQANGNMLRWSTASELHNDYFEIQRSEDGSNFTTIHRLSGQGTTSQQTSYHYLDPNYKSSLSYYRLKQFDFNGQFTFSQIITIIRTEEWSVYPNPAQESAVIKGALPDLMRSYHLSVVDTRGRVIESIPISSTEHSFSLNLNTSTLDAGVYFILLRDAEGNEFGKCKFLVY